ncbi:type II toxin-antitoxin system RelE/ParE family toxin [uncultured Cytophaga sp.]|uniref:type II toxin-antitoxin system RelE/ParE family toxin n=1 Tax=uncultured Cytophaga sp. TaxID=160238 RepID=UPI0034538538
MAYSIIVSARAQKEIEHAIDYYALYSVDAPKKFIQSLANAYITLQSNPYFKIQYKNIRSLKLTIFPYSLFFVINQANYTVRIIACFHNKRNPDNRP